MQKQSASLSLSTFLEALAARLVSGAGSDALDLAGCKSHLAATVEALPKCALRTALGKAKGKHAATLLAAVEARRAAAFDAQTRAGVESARQRGLHRKLARHPAAAHRDIVACFASGGAAAAPLVAEALEAFRADARLDRGESAAATLAEHVQSFAFAVRAASADELQRVDQFLALYQVRRTRWSACASPGGAKRARGLGLAPGSLRAAIERQSAAAAAATLSTAAASAACDCAVADILATCADRGCALAPLVDRCAALYFARAEGDADATDRRATCLALRRVLQAHARGGAAPSVAAVAAQLRAATVLHQLATPSLALASGEAPTLALYLEFTLAVRVVSRGADGADGGGGAGGGAGVAQRLAAAAHKLRLVAQSVAAPPTMATELQVLRSKGGEMSSAARALVDRLIAAAKARSVSVLLLNLDDDADEALAAVLASLERSDAASAAAAAAAQHASAAEAGGLFFIDGASSAKRAKLAEGLDGSAESAAVASLVRSLAANGPSGEVEEEDEEDE